MAMFTFIKKQQKRFYHAFSGLFVAFKTDFSYRWQVIGGAIAIGTFIYIFGPLSETETLFLILAWVLILITEIQNSATEAALDRIHPELHDSIGKSKDMAAGAVLTAGFFLLFVMAIIAIT